MKNEHITLLLFYWFCQVYGFDYSDTHGIAGISLLSDKQSSLLSKQKCSGESEQFINQCLQVKYL